ncbi:MAG: ATP-binding protein [Bdellovibrionales bacterium]|nr:ATP-binding protein [Bdellovibrionales bacterium]
MKFILILFISSLWANESTFTELSQWLDQPQDQISYQEVTKKWKQTATLEVDSSELENKTHYLLKLSQLRSEIIAHKSEQIHFNEYIEDSLFELKFIPIKWVSIFENKSITLKNKISQKQWEDLYLEFFTLCLILLLPYFVVRLNQWINQRIDVLKRSVIRSHESFSWKHQLAIRSQWITPYIPYVLSLIALDFLNDFIQKTILSELSLIIPFLEFYIYYLIFKKTVLNILRVVSEKVMLEGRQKTKFKIIKDSKTVGRFFFWSLVLLHTVSSVSSKGLVYRELFIVLVIVGFFIGLKLVANWQEEVDYIFKEYMSEKNHQRYKNIKQNKLYKIISPFLFLFSIFLPVWEVIKENVSTWTITRSIAARFFKKKLESSDTQDNTDKELPEEYKQAMFSSATEEQYIESKDKVFEKICLEIDEWLSEKSDEHSLAIYGDRGCGKSELLKKVKAHYQSCNIIHSDVPSKTTKKSDVFNFISTTFEDQPVSELTDILKIDQSLKKPTVVILNQAHNFFLSQIGELEGIKTFFEVLNLQTKNIFWMAAFNTYSWVYLDQAFRKNKYFRVAIQVPKLSEEELQKFIMKRHNSTGYKLSFADIIKVLRPHEDAQGEHLNYLESLFFRMLWEQSKGNPSLAAQLWIDCLKPYGNKRLKVGLPKTQEVRFLSSLSDDNHFVYASLIKHENLTSKELIGTTDLPEATVRHALRIGLENEVVMRGEDGRYRYTVSGQYGLTQFLKAKNFIYE